MKSKVGQNAGNHWIRSTCSPHIPYLFQQSPIWFPHILTFPVPITALYPKWLSQNAHLDVLPSCLKLKKIERQRPPSSTWHRGQCFSIFNAHVNYVGRVWSSRCRVGPDILLSLPATRGCGCWWAEDHALSSRIWRPF